MSLLSAITRGFGFRLGSRAADATLSSIGSVATRIKNSNYSAEDEASDREALAEVNARGYIEVDIEDSIEKFRKSSNPVIASCNALGEIWRQENIYKKYGETELADRLAAKEVWLGMTEENLRYRIDAHRTPKVEESATAKGVVRTLIYGANKWSGDSYTFVDGILTSYKDK